MAEHEVSTAGNLSALTPDDVRHVEQTKKNLFTGGSVLGAVAMSSCCILPLALFSVGVTGVWIGNLSALYPYKWVFFVLTGGFLAGGFYMVYRKQPSEPCETGSFCATPGSDRIKKAALWGATALALMAMAFPYIAPAFLET